MKRLEPGTPVTVKMNNGNIKGATVVSCEGLGFHVIKYDRRGNTDIVHSVRLIERKI